MRVWLSGFLCGALLFGALPLLAEEVFRIVPGTGEDRITKLERAVAQLQGKVYGDSPAPALVAGCTRDARLDGVFSGGSREEVLKKCREATKGGIYCREKEVRCR